MNRPWEAEGYSDSDVSDDESEEKVRKRAGEELVDVLLDAYFEGTMPAITVCIICHWASEGGIKEAEKFAMPPNKQTGKYKQKLDKVLGANVFSEELYELGLVAHGRHDLSRGHKIVRCGVPHNMLDAEFQEDPHRMRALLEEKNP